MLCNATRDMASVVAERIRTAFAVTAADVDRRPVKATVSIAMMVMPRRTDVPVGRAVAPTAKSAA